MVRRNADRSETCRRGDSDRAAVSPLVRAVPALALVALAGFALAGCGGGSGEALPGTGTRSTPTRAATTAETSTETETRPVVLPPRTVTSIETQTVPVPVTTEEPAASSSSDTPWGWIALGVALAAGLLIAFLLWRRHRAGAPDWGAQTADLNRRCLIALDEVLSKGSVVTGQIEALAAEMRSLEGRAPDDPSRAAAARVRAHLDTLAATLEADRTLRLSTPPPSAEQLAYSSSLIREQAAELRAVLLPPSTGDAWA
jgi:hypothetical protein